MPPPGGSEAASSEPKVPRGERPRLRKIASYAKLDAHRTEKALRKAQKRLGLLPRNAGKWRGLDAREIVALAMRMFPNEKPAVLKSGRGKADTSDSDSDTDMPRRRLRAVKT